MNEPIDSIISVKKQTSNLKNCNLLKIPKSTLFKRDFDNIRILNKI